MVGFLKISAITMSVLVLVFLYRFKKMGIESEGIDPKLGVENGVLKPCGDKPNCSSSTHKDEKFRVEVLKYSQDLALVRPMIEKILNDLEITILQSESNYLYGIHKSKFWGFVDDVELQFNANTKEIHFRSASRVGYSDLGVNKKRLTKIIEEIKLLKL